jgi:hypothetical protein
MQILTRQYPKNLCLSLTAGALALTIGIMSLNSIAVIETVPVKTITPIPNDGKNTSLVQQAHRFDDPTPTNLDQEFTWGNELEEPLCLCNLSVFGGDEMLHWEVEIKKMWHHEFSGEECCTRCRTAKN